MPESQLRNSSLPEEIVHLLIGARDVRRGDRMVLSHLLTRQSLMIPRQVAVFKLVALKTLVATRTSMPDTRGGLNNAVNARNVRLGQVRSRY